ncbi:type II toxin-antitoxin system RelE/ParE family toxin [Candidatus Peregrinibacteria bacterium]|nr:type II toxin-antitoxin system RelE/ParE family toxin [Candidatus Peregrinibacteria bacterium]
MIYRLVYTKKALTDLECLDKKTAKRILDKIGYFCDKKNPLIHAKKLQNSTWGTYRFRIGDYRAIFDVDKNGNLHILLILTIKHRKDVYRAA